MRDCFVCVSWFKIGVLAWDVVDILIAFRTYDLRIKPGQAWLPSIIEDEEGVNHPD